MTKQTITMAIIEDDYNEYVYVEESEISCATLGDLIESGFDYENCGLKYEGENEEGEALYSGYDFDGKLTIEELSEEPTDWFVIKWWDGNNCQIKVFEYYSVEEMTVERDYDSEPKPLYNYCYNLIKENGEIIRTTQSNMSGSLSPFYNLVGKHEWC